jgi:beta-galactosidase
MKLRKTAGAACIALSLLFVACAAYTGHKTSSTAEAVSISAGWEYLENNTVTLAEATSAGPWVPVDLPHTWNAFDSVDSVPGYRRDASWYRKSITIAPGPDK